ncbi:hypothetical protein [Burkholderia ubonensis]|uniref:hypothetical protein n=1 Tax=Burkholderia ubonensis TaxID=101571 RepID=UPI0007581458|nr:hypothetical protein [Burkholderia ubonensis]KVA16545.1 hypothetical protein WI42_17935 [Burkholderia ubonensis]KVA33121.1 hypothetical protein WI43_27440 [Burkholderia ubonensis]KVA35251.1 hypothetical protein WI46_21485 [Burkholderia ubonensis]
MTLVTQNAGGIAHHAGALMIRAPIQGIRLVDPRERASLRREMQRALGCYLEERLGIAGRRTSETR